MLVLRELTSTEIMRLASKKGVDRIATVNFLSALNADIGFAGNIQDLNTDARSYNWNKETVLAIRDGIRIASKV